MNKYSGMIDKPTNEAQMKCNKWLAYCLEIGFATKDQLDKLEAIWWDYYDYNGNIKQKAQVGDTNK